MTDSEDRGEPIATPSPVHKMFLYKQNMWTVKRIQTDLPLVWERGTFSKLTNRSPGAVLMVSKTLAKAIEFLTYASICPSRGFSKLAKYFAMSYVGILYNIGRF